MSRHRRAKLRCNLLPSSRYLQLGKRGLNQRKLNRKTMPGDARQPLGVGRQLSGPRGDITNLQTRKLTLSESRNSLATMEPGAPQLAAASRGGASGQMERNS